MFKVNYRKTRSSCEICSKSIVKTPERRHWRRLGVFIANYEYISHLVLVFLLLALSKQLPTGLKRILFFMDCFIHHGMLLNQQEAANKCSPE